MSSDEELLCSICGFQGDFILPYSGISQRESVCPQCTATRKTRDVAQQLLISVKKENSYIAHNLDAFKKLHILEFNTHGALHATLKNLPHYTAIEPFRSNTFNYNENFNTAIEDIHYLKFLDATKESGYDIVITEDVFEYLDDPWSIFKEIERILRPSGQHIFTIPIHNGRKTQMRAERTSNGEIKHHLPAIYRQQSEYLKFTDFGDDFIDLLQNMQIKCEQSFYKEFYSADKIPNINSEAEHKRYTFFNSRNKVFSYLLYNSVVFTAYGKQNPTGKVEDIRILFSNTTTPLQICINSDFFDKYEENVEIKIHSIRGEQVDFFGKNILWIDIVLNKGHNQPSMLFMVGVVIGELSTFIFPDIFKDSSGIIKFTKEVLYKYIAIIKEQSLPFCIDTHGNNIKQHAANIDVFEGLSSYTNVFAHIRRYAFLYHRLQKNGIKEQTANELNYINSLSLINQKNKLKSQHGDEPSLNLGRVKKICHSPYFHWNEMSVEQLLSNQPLDKTTYSLITCFDCMEYIDNPHPFLESIKASLAPNGEFYISILNQLVFDFNKNEHHYSLLQIKTLLEMHFEHVEYFYQDDTLGDLSHRLLINQEENPSAKYYMACCKNPILSMRPTCKVSIIMPLYNNFSYTKIAVEKIYETMPSSISWELILIDNASSDDTVNYKAIDSKTYIHKNLQNEGFAKASNQGALLARGEIFVFLNNDTEVQSGWIEALIDELTMQEKTGLVSGRLIYPDNTIQHAGVVVGRDKIPYHIHRGLEMNDPLVLQRLAYPIVTGACLATRCEDFFAIGMFDELFINGHEDIDLCIRYRQNGFNCIYRPDCVVVHHESISEGRMDSRFENLQRTLAKSYENLVQDDFLFKSLPTHIKNCHAKQLKFAIKIGPPDRTHGTWGDVFFAECFAKELANKGHGCEIHYLNEWGKDDYDMDVVIHIKGLSEYMPKPWNFNIMWMINHPELHTKEELERYDVVCVASTPYAKKLATEISKPVYSLLQATDPEHFASKKTPPKHIQEKLDELDDEYDVVFVGNNEGIGRDDIRKVVGALLPKNNVQLAYSLAVWGKNWDNILPTGCHKGDFIDWQLLPYIYARAKIVLNDHQLSMAEKGFINNRTFDVAACCVAQLSDAVLGMDNEIDITQCSTSKDLQKAVKNILKDPTQAKKQAQKNYDNVIKNFSFAKRVEEIYDIINSHRNEKILKRITTIKNEAFSQSFITNGPLVSILMSTYNRNEFLSNAIKSIIDQSYQNWELCLVCDGGTPVNNIVNFFNDSRIRLLHKETNDGKSKCINLAFKMSKGEYIAYLDDDDIWYKNHLEKLMRPLCHMQGFSMAYSNEMASIVNYENPNNIHETARGIRYDKQLTLPEMLEFNQISGISVVHARDLFEKTGGFDQNLPVLIDFDMWRRLMCFSYAFHVSYVTAEHYTRQNIKNHSNITGLYKKNLLSYIKHRIKLLHKKLPNKQEENLKELLKDIRKRILFEFFHALCEQAYKNKNKKRYIKLLPILVKYCNSLSAKSRLAIFLVQIEYLQQAFEVFVDIFPLVKQNNHTLFMMLLCALQLQNPFAHKVLNALKDNSNKMMPKELELLKLYEERVMNIKPL